MNGYEYDLPKALDRKISKAVASLNEALAELQQTFPKANWYLEDSENLCLMSDETHNHQGDAQQQNVIKVFNLNCSSGGGW